MKNSGPAYELAGWPIRSVRERMTHRKIAGGLCGVMIAAGLGASAVAAHPPPVPASPSVARACRTHVVQGRKVPPPLVRSARAPNPLLLSHVGVLRRPAIAADRISLGQLNLRPVERPFEVLAVYVRYVRVVTGPAGARIALIPARVCFPSVLSFPGRPHIRLAPADWLLMKALSGPSSPGPPLGAKARQIASSGATVVFYNDSTHSATRVQIVPNGVARIVYRFPCRCRRSSVTATVHGNVAIANPTPQRNPTRTLWYNAAGKLIRTLHPPVGFAGAPAH